MADEKATPSTPLLADVLNQLATRDRWALVQHLNDGIAHANQVADRLRAAEASPPPPTLRQVEVHLLAAICPLDLVAGALGLARWYPLLPAPGGPAGRGGDDAG